MRRFSTVGVIALSLGIYLLLAGASSGEAALTATYPDGSPNGAILKDGVTLNRNVTLTFHPDDPGAEVTVFLDGVFYAALGSPFVLPLEMKNVATGSHVLRVEERSVSGQVRQSLEVNFQVSGDVRPDLIQNGVILQSAVPSGEPHEVQVAAVAKVVGTAEGEEYPLILRSLNRAVRAKFMETFSQLTPGGRPTLEREIQDGSVWFYLPSEDKYVMTPVPDKGQKTQFTVNPSGAALTGPEEAGSANLGMLALGMPNARVKPGEGWASEIETVVDLTGMSGKIATGQHVLTGYDWAGDRLCAVISSKYSLEGPLTVKFGDQPFLLSRVTAEGTRESYYDFEAGRFLQARDSVNCSIFLTQEEKDQLESLLKPKGQAPEVQVGFPPLGAAGWPLVRDATLAAAFAASKKDGKPVMAFFTAPWSDKSKEMEARTLNDPAVIQELMRFHVVYVDYDKNVALADRYGFAGVPALVFFPARSENPIFPILSVTSSADLIQSIRSRFPVSGLSPAVPGFQPTQPVQPVQPVWTPQPAGGSPGTGASQMPAGLVLPTSEDEGNNAVTPPMTAPTPAAVSLPQAPRLSPAAAAIPPELTPWLGPDRKLLLEALPMLRQTNPQLLAAWVRSFPDIFPNEIRKPLGLPILVGGRELPPVLVPAQPAALVVNYSLDVVTLSQ